MRTTIIRIWALFFAAVMLCACAGGTERRPPERFVPHPSLSELITDFPKWERVKQQERLFSSFEGPLAHGADAAKAAQWANLYVQCLDADIMTRLNLVNLFFNQWPYIEDRDNYGLEDFWALPHEFMERGGDCEDFAIAKYYALKALGVAADDMCIAVVWNAKRLEGHAVLAVRVGTRDFVLDNFRDELILWASARHYVPLFYINEHFIWLDPGLKANRPKGTPK